ALSVLRVASLSSPRTRARRCQVSSSSASAARKSPTRRRLTPRLWAAFSVVRSSSPKSCRHRASTGSSSSRACPNSPRHRGASGHWVRGVAPAVSVTTGWRLTVVKNLVVKCWVLADLTQDAEQVTTLWRDPEGGSVVLADPLPPPLPPPRGKVATVLVRAPV